MKWLKIATLSLFGIVIAIFALMGFLYATKGTPAHAVRSVEDPSGPPAIGDSSFLRSVELLTATDFQTGHSVELLYDGDGTFPRLWQDLRSARHSIIVQLYYYKPGATADSLKRILMERAHAGVAVLMLLDAFGASSLSQEYIDSLRVAGVRYADFRPVRWYTLHKTQNRAHSRAIIIDGRIAYTGGFGIADVWLGNGHTPDQWRETNVRFTGPAVAQTQAAFAVAWVEATGDLLTGNTAFAVSEPSDSAGLSAAMLSSMPTLGSSAAERYLALSIAGARRTLYISNAYFVPDADLTGLLSRAVKRGVDVRVLTAASNTDVKIVRRAAHARYEELLRNGIRIYEYQPAMMHAKTLVADGVWSTVGTLNFDNRSLAFNDESSLMVMDTAFAGLLEAKFLDDLRHSNEFALASFQKRPTLTKLLDGAAGWVAKML